MDDLLNQFAELKVSAFSKAKFLNHCIDRVTIGPKSVEAAPPIAKTEIGEVKVKKQEHVVREVVVPPVKQILCDVELERQQKVQDAINQRKEKLLNFGRQQERLGREQWSQTQKLLAQRMQQQETRIVQVMEEHERNSAKYQEQLVQYHLKLAERRKEHERAIRARQEHQRHVAEMIEAVSRTQTEFTGVYVEIVQRLRDEGDEVKTLIKEDVAELGVLSPQMDDVIGRCRSGNVDERDVDKCAGLLQAAKQVKTAIDGKIAEHAKRKTEVIPVRTEVVPVQTVVEPPPPQPPAQIVVPDVKSFVRKGALKMYAELQTFLQENELAYKALMENPSMNAFKFECRKAVNIPVSALSAVGRSHLLDKYTRLHDLLAGKTVQIGDAQISAAKYPQGIPFCKDLLARKFVLQGDLMISSNPEAAFYYASVIVSLWNDFPDFGRLFLAHLHRRCPFLVPIYLPRAVDQTDEEYYTSLGYQYQDGVVEKQDKYLKRMTGIFRLYFAVLTAKPKAGRNPHDITNGWRWMTNVLNLEPHADVTATALHVFLEVTGAAMERTYGKQFRKLVDFTANVYSNSLKRCDSGGPLARLSGLVEDYYKNGRFEEPKGSQSAGFL